ncbi:MAG: bifunctional 4-hydroxy-2-oxoglutarate aldolase/2-dehydro-3-deoxy-phosphogluconate aldolase [Prolixibacteraceae bacterium]|jgi:2-dehydro-3-deoxyphosphogluconate aldolase/(4S)-4-hydroxy-2-oxoglutarate aldolase|nr:bifunctional 4-hydroxy-2-oxoglutarate aldolase/2-dehydro-3-deoxy-phosphogluconate aldolase [Prolixibacteraceae bacterium]
MNVDIYQRIEKFRIVPVIAIEDADSALALADALIEGGLPVAEVTFRTMAASTVISKIAKERPEVLIGAGTILTIDNLKKAIDCGAKFGVSPGFNPNIAEEALKLNFPFSPGVMTPSDVENALSLGIRVLKFFPAEAAGGTKMLKSLAAPYSHLGVRFIPTGGINPEILNNYLSIPQVLAVGGTWIAKAEDINNKNWKQISINCKWETK